MALARKLVIISATYIFVLLNNTFDGRVMACIITRAMSALGSRFVDRISLHQLLIDCQFIGKLLRSFILKIKLCYITQIWT